MNLLHVGHTKEVQMPKLRSVAVGTLVAVVTAMFCVEDARAQGLRVETGPEAFVSIGMAHLLEPEYVSPAWSSVGAGLILPVIGRLAARIEFNQMIGLSLDTVTGVRQTDMGGAAIPFTARHGTSSSKSLTGSALYYFSASRFQPFVGVGIGAVWQEGVWYWSGGGSRPAQEYEFQTTSLSIPVSGGLRVLLPGGIALTPEVRFQNASVTIPASSTTSEVKLDRGITRVSIAFGYGW